MTTHTREHANTQSASATITAGELITFIDTIDRRGSDLGFLAQAANDATLPIVSTQMKTIHVAGCSALKPSKRHRTEQTPARGLTLRKCCRNIRVRSALSSDSSFVRSYEWLARKVRDTIADTSWAQFRRIMDLESLRADCANLRIDAKRPEYAALIDALEEKLAAAFGECSEEQADREFTIAQVARIAVGTPRQGFTGPQRWLRANYPLFCHLAGAYRAPFTVPLLIPGLIADLLEEGHHLDAIPELVARQAHIYMTRVYLASYWVRTNTLTDADKAAAEELDKQVAIYLENIVKEAESPTVLTRDGDHLVVHSAISPESFTAMWWARKNGIEPFGTRTISVDSLDYEWMRRQELRFVDAEDLRLSTQVGDTWDRGQKSVIISEAISVAGQRRAEYMLKFEEYEDAPDH